MGTLVRTDSDATVQALFRAVSADSTAHPPVVGVSDLWEWCQARHPVWGGAVPTTHSGRSHSHSHRHSHSHGEACSDSLTEVFDAVQRTASLRQVSFETAYAVFSNYMDTATSSIDLPGFEHAMAKFMVGEQSPSPAQLWRPAVQRLFAQVADSVVTLPGTNDDSAALTNAALRHLVVKLTGCDLVGSGAAFAVFDADGDGAVDHQDILQVLVHCGMPMSSATPAASVLMQVGDVNGDRRWTPFDFAMWKAHASQAGDSDEANPRMASLQRLITRVSGNAVDMLRQALGELSCEAVQQLAVAADARGDLRLSSALQCLSSLFGTPNPLLRRTLRWLVDIFDDGLRGCVKWRQLAAGMMPLLRGSAEDKALHTFALYAWCGWHL